MGLTVITKPDTAAVSIEEVKTHLRLDWTDAAEDALLLSDADQATSWWEDYTHRALLATTYELTLPRFPAHGEIMLPRGRCRSVEWIKYTDPDGNQQTLTGPTSGSPAGTDYQEDLTSDEGGRVLYPYDGSWPSVREYTLAPVTVRFTAGLGDDVDELPAAVKSALLYKVADLYEIRSGVDARQAANDFLQVAERLAMPYLLRTG